MQKTINPESGTQGAEVLVCSSYLRDKLEYVTARLDGLIALIGQECRTLEDGATAGIAMIVGDLLDEVERAGPDTNDLAEAVADAHQVVCDLPPGACSAGGVRAQLMNVWKELSAHVERLYVATRAA